MSGIRVSKQFGVNPTCLKCEICGEDAGIALFGTGYKENGETAEAPMYMTMHGHYCKRCEDALRQGGIFFIEVRDGESGPNPYRTGRLVCVKEDAVKNMIREYQKINFIEQTLFERLFGEVIND